MFSLPVACGITPIKQVRTDYIFYKNMLNKFKRKRKMDLKV